MATVKLIDLAGDARQRGEAHGEAMRDEIVAGIERWRDQLDAVQPLTPDGFIDHVRTKTQFAQSVERHTPALLEEVRGIAVGANLAFDTVFAYQLLDECWWLAAQLAQPAGIEGEL